MKLIKFLQCKSLWNITVTPGKPKSLRNQNMKNLTIFGNNPCLKLFSDCQTQSGNFQDNLELSRHYGKCR